MSNKQTTIEEKKALLASVKLDEAKFKEETKGLAGVYDEDHMRRASELAKQIAELESAIEFQKEQQQNFQENANQELENAYAEFIKDKDMTDLQKARFRNKVINEGVELKEQITPKLLQDIMAERFEEFAKKDEEEVIKETETVEGDSGTNVADLKEPEKSSDFKSIITAMASGDPNFIPSDDPEKIETFFTQLNKENDEYRKAVKAEEISEEA